MLRSFTSYNATLVTLIHGNPRYEKMSPKEVIGKFHSHEMMVKDSKHIKDLAQGNVTTIEPQPIALKATSEAKEEPSSKEKTIDVFELDDEEMALIIKNF
jgi:hypothetical protein